MMRTLSLLIFTVFHFGTVQAMAQSCESLFSELPMPSAPAPIIVENIPASSNRIELTKITNSSVPEKLTLEKMDFSKNVDQASIELMRLLLQNSSYILEEKNVLSKGELVIGIPVRNGYFFEVTYKSLSNERSQFIIDKISLKTPTGADSKKIAEGFLSGAELSLRKSEFEIGNILGKDINAKLKIPLAIDGPLLTKLDTLAKFFEFFRKDEMRALLTSNSMLKIRTVFEFRRARDVFFKVLFKEPMKTAIGFGFIILATGMSPMNLSKPADVPMNPPAVEAVLPREVSKDLMLRINQFEIPQEARILKGELYVLNEQIKREFSQKEAYSGPTAGDIILDQKNAFSMQHKTWVFEQVDPYNKSVHTYLVFAEEKMSAEGPGLQYMVMKINPTLYPELIKFIKSQGQIFELSKKAAK
jgi:hypothetical protein